MGGIREYPKVLLVANVAKEHVLKFHVPLLEMLMQRGWHVDVACAGDEEIPYCKQHFVMSYKRCPFNFALFKGICELKKIIEAGQYDIIYCHTPVGGLAARIAAIKERKRGTKVIYFAHGYHFFKNAPKLNWLIYYPMEKMMSKLTDSIILINEEDYKLTQNKFTSCKAYLLNGIGVDTSRFRIKEKEEKRFDYRKRMNIPQDATVLIYLAELLPNKNQKFLIRCLKKVLVINDNVYLVLAGFDHSDGDFEKYTKELKVEQHVRFLGWREDVAELYNMSDICTATSIREGFGLNLVEAMLCEVPVIATNNRGHKTIIRDGENGFLVELGDEEKFVDRIVKLIQDEEIRTRFVEQGKKEQGKYSSDAIVENIYTIMRDHLQ